MLRKPARLFAILAFAVAITVHPQPAKAVLPVFDPANFAKMIDLLVQEGTITAQNAQKLYYDYNIAIEAYNNGHLNIAQTLQDLQPDLDQLFSHISRDQSVIDLAKTAASNFGSGNQGWTNQAMYQYLYGDLQSQIQATTQTFIQDAQRGRNTVADAMKDTDKARRDMLAAKGQVDTANAMGKELAAIAAIDAEIHERTAAMVTDMSNAFTYTVQRDADNSNQAGRALLRGSFGNAINVLGSPAPTPTIVPIR